MQKKLFLILAVLLCQGFLSYSSSSDDDDDRRPPRSIHKKPGSGFVPHHITSEGYAISQLNLQAGKLKLDKAREDRETAEFMARQQFHRQQLAEQKIHDDLIAREIALEERKIAQTEQARREEQARLQKQEAKRQHDLQEEKQQRARQQAAAKAEKAAEAEWEQNLAEATDFVRLWATTVIDDDLFMKRISGQLSRGVPLSKQTVSEILERRDTVRQAEEIAQNNLTRKGFYGREVAQDLCEALRSPDVGISYAMALAIIDADAKDQAAAKREAEAHKRAAAKAEQKAERERIEAEHAKTVSLRPAKIAYLKSVGYSPAALGFYKDEDLDKKTLAQIKKMFA